MKILHFIIIFLFSIHGFSQKALNQKITKQLEQEKLAGVVWACINDNNINIEAAGFGNLKSKTRLKPTDKVHIGSITKSILAIGVLKMATEGMLNLDQPITHYLPHLQINNPFESTNPVTIRNLLGHTAGLNDLKLWHIFSTTAQPNTDLKEAFGYNQKLLKVNTAPGTVFSYSNMGYTLIGMVIEAVTKQTYESYMDAYFLKPIGMVNSTFQFRSQQGNNADSLLAMGHLDNGQTYPTISNYLRPAMQFTTTAQDMAIFMQFILNDGKVGGKQLISRELIGQVGLSATAISTQNGMDTGYGFGFGKREKYGASSLYHSGNMLGYKAYMYIFKKQGKAFFTAFNLDSESANYEKFNELIAKQIGVKKDIATPPVAVFSQNIYDGYYIPLFTKIEPFRLFDYANNFVKISVRNGMIEYSPFLGKTLHLQHVKGGLFKLQDKAVVSHCFYDQNSTKHITNGLLTLKMISGWKILTVVFSLGFGILCLLLSFTMGTFQLLTQKTNFKNQPFLGLWFALFVVFGSIILMYFRPFMEIANPNFANYSLAAGSILLPFGAIYGLIKHHQFKSLIFWVLFGCLQLCIVLIFNGIFPIILWK